MAMTRDQWRHVKEIATGALERPEAERSRYVAARCEGDAALHAEVASLVESATRAADLFETPSVLISGARFALETLEAFDTGRIGERLGPYRIVSELGGGGMGTAYLAARADGTYHKQVAIKVIKRGMDTDAVLRRFRRERQVLADLDHPHIARLLDGGTTDDGLPYFVMEYVEGVPIDVHCATGGLSIAERLAIVRRVCDAVHHAHEHRVVHRDLKPGNILVTPDGTPKLLDFGISKLLSPDPAGDRTDPTGTVRAMTPQYASPEQVRGDPITRATDVYSLGVLLYELLTGGRPYQLDGRTLQQIDEAICTEMPQKPSVAAGRAGRARLAGDLDDIVLMALRKEPERRYETAQALSDDLGRYLEGLPVRARADDLGYRAAKFLGRHRTRVLDAAVATALAAAIGLVIWWPRADSAPPGSAVGSVAVLPFVNAGGDADTEYLSDGLTESLIRDLSRYEAFAVTPRNVAFGFKGQAVDARDIARRLRVGALLLGRVSSGAGDVAVSLELVDGGDGRRLWRAEYGAPLSGLVGLREQISREAARQLAPAAGVPRSAARHTPNPEAYRLYLRGRYVWNKRTEEGFVQGLEYFRQALEKDPQYALAYVGVADCYNLLGIWGALPPREAMPKVKEAALEAIKIDDSLAEAHTSLAFVRWVYDWDWDGAAAEFRRALELDPHYATAHDWYGYYLASMGRFDEAIAELRQADDLEPVSLSINTDVGEIYYWSRQPDRALEQLRGVLQVEPDFPMARNILGLTYLAMGRLPEAVEELETANRLSTGPRMISTLAYAYGSAGAREKARASLDTLLRLSAERYTSPFALAVASAGAGDRDRAFAYLERAFDERSDSMVILRVYPLVDDLRGDPRFEDLVRRVGLPAN